MMKYERVKADFHAFLLNVLGRLHAETRLHREKIAVYKQDTGQCPREGPEMVKNHASRKSKPGLLNRSHNTA
jgi:hypothetical protein